MHVYWSVSCTWPTISGIPRARSISCRAMTSAVLSRESSWSRSALSSLWPSLWVRGPSNSSKGFPNWSLQQETTGDFEKEHRHRHFLMWPMNSAWASMLKKMYRNILFGPVQNIYLLVFLCGPSILRAVSCQEGDWGGGPCPPNRFMPILGSLVPAEVEMGSYQISPITSQSICIKFFVFR